MAKTKAKIGDRVYLVLSKAYLGPVYIDSAWANAESAQQRIQDLTASAQAFECSQKLDLKTLEIRMDVMGIPIVIDVYEGEETLASIPGRAKGGRARSESLTADERSKIARNAANARWRHEGEENPPPAQQEDASG